MLDVASQTLFTDSDSDVRDSEGVRFRAIFGLELDCGSCGEANHWEQVEDPWEVRERLLYRLVLRILSCSCFATQLVTNSSLVCVVAILASHTLLPIAC